MLLSPEQEVPSTNVSKLVLHLASKLKNDGIYATVGKMPDTLLVMKNASEEYIFKFSTEASSITEQGSHYTLPAEQSAESLYTFIYFEISRNINKQIEFSAAEFVQSIGIQTNLKGYRFLITAICLCVENPELMNSYMGQLYPAVAKAHSTASCLIDSFCVERNIRSAVERAYINCPKQLQERFHYPVAKPTCSEVISLAADFIRRKYL